MSGYFLIQIGGEFGSEKLQDFLDMTIFFSVISCSFISGEWISGGCLGAREDADVPAKALQRTKYFQGEATVTSSSLNFSVEKVPFWELLDVTVFFFLRMDYTP